MIILGIDPGTATTGFGIIKKSPPSQRAGKTLKCLDYGVIQTSPSASAPDRLKTLNDALNNLIKKHKPEVLAVENLYFFKNIKTAMPVSQAKGVILLTAAKKGIPVYEFTPLQVKMSVAGYGKAEKKQVQRMVQCMLNLKELPKPDDASDAIAIAICCAKSIDASTRLGIKSE